MLKQWSSSIASLSRKMLGTGDSSSKPSRIEAITLPVEEPLKDDQIRFVCISDTHGRHDNWRVPMPNGDVLIHAGDFSMVGGVPEIVKFNDFLGSLPHPHKIVIAGNHDLSFDREMPPTAFHWRRTERTLTEAGLETGHSLLTNCCYLENTSVKIAGYKIFGSPQSPEFGCWAFMYKPGASAAKHWEKIPDDVDVLVTHGPPLGFGDLVHNGIKAGCADLLKTVQKRVKPQYHIFGHIHEDWGVTTDGTTTYINASICDLRYRPNNPPVIFDLPMPEGMTRTELHALRLSPE